MSNSDAVTFDFPPPPDGDVDLLVLAGEHSGDEHAARMVKGALALQPDLRISALGGRHLQAAGAQVLFDLTQYSVVGFFEVLKHYGELKQLFDEILRWIRTYQPKAVCFVDYPGMNLRIAKKLMEEGTAAKSGGSTRLLYYIGPQVWAWKEKRKYQMGEMLDSLAVIFPFEVEVFADTGLDTRFVGHPFLSSDYELPLFYDASGPIVLLPGSRKSSVARIAPILFESFRECVKLKKKLTAVCIYPTDTLLQDLKAILANYPDIQDQVTFLPNDSKVGARATLTSSGTMSLNCALASIPGAIVYKTHPITYLIGKAFVKIEYIGIANLLLNRPLYPEFIQGAAQKSVLGRELVECIESDERIRETRTLSAALRESLDEPSSGDASQWLVENIR